MSQQPSDTKKRVLYTVSDQTKVEKHGITQRRIRISKKNDTGHIERFNRTLQEECLGNRITSRVAAATLQTKINQNTLSTTICNEYI